MTWNFNSPFHRFRANALCSAERMQANAVAIHEFGKELEGRINKLQYLAVLFSAAFGSGVFMIATGRPVGVEALLPVGASGKVFKKTNSTVRLSLTPKV